MQLYDVVEGQAPRLLYAVLHKHGPVNRMQWQPKATWPSACGGNQGVGILALALASGGIMLLGMPRPASVQQVVGSVVLLTHTNIYTGNKSSDAGHPTALHCARIVFRQGRRRQAHGALVCGVAPARAA